MAKQTIEIADKQTLDKVLEEVQSIDGKVINTDEVGNLVRAGYQVPLSKCGTLYLSDSTDEDTGKPIIIGDKLLYRKRLTNMRYTGNDKTSSTNSRYVCVIADLFTKEILQIVRTTSNFPTAMTQQVVRNDYTEYYYFNQTSYTVNTSRYPIGYIKRRRVYKDGSYEETDINPNTDDLYTTTGHPCIKEACGIGSKIIDHEDKTIFLIVKTSNIYSATSSYTIKPTHIQPYYLDENDVLQPLAEKIAYNALFNGNTTSTHSFIDPFIFNYDGKYLYILYNSYESNTADSNRSIIIIDTTTGTVVKSSIVYQSYNFYDGEGFPTGIYSQFCYNNKMYLLNTSGFLMEFVYDIENDIMRFDVVDFIGFIPNGCKIVLIDGVLHFIGYSAYYGGNNEIYIGCTLSYSSGNTYVDPTKTHYTYELPTT